MNRELFVIAIAGQLDTLYGGNAGALWAVAEQLVPKMPLDEDVKRLFFELRTLAVEQLLDEAEAVSTRT